MYLMRKYWHNLALVDNDGSEGSVSEIVSHQCFSYGGITDEGNTGGVVATANAVDYSVDGDIYQLAASSTIWDCRGLTSIAGSAPYQKVAFCADSAGATTALQGTAAASAAAATFPTITDGATVLGYVEMDCSHLSTTEEYAWDQVISSHGTFHNGLTRSFLFETIS